VDREGCSRRRLPGRARADVTQARRPHHDRDPYYRQTTRPKTNGRSRTLVKPYRPTTGDRVPVQQRVTRNGRQTVETCGHIILTSVRIAPAGDLTFTDARQMGYRTTTDAMAAWLSDHDPAGLVDPDTLETCQACGGPGIDTDGYCVTCGCDDQPHARFTANTPTGRCGSSGSSLTRNTSRGSSPHHHPPNPTTSHPPPSRYRTNRKR
jgi:hypothetical protein